MLCSSESRAHKISAQKLLWHPLLTSLALALCTYRSNPVSRVSLKIGKEEGPLERGWRRSESPSKHREIGSLHRRFEIALIAQELSLYTNKPWQWLWFRSLQQFSDSSLALYTTVNFLYLCTYRNITTISILLATSSSGASESRSTCKDSLYRADAVAYPPACHTTQTFHYVTHIIKKNISYSKQKAKI